MSSYSIFIQLLRNNEMMEAPHPNVEGKKPHIFQHCIFTFAQYTTALIQGWVVFFFFFPHITVLLSFHTTRKIILHQCKRTAKHLQAMIHIRLLQCAEIKIILFTCHLQMQVFLSRVHLCKVLE